MLSGKPISGRGFIHPEDIFQGRHQQTQVQKPISGYVDLNPARRLGKINAPKITKNVTEISPEAAQKLADFQESLKK